MQFPIGVMFGCLRSNIETSLAWTKEMGITHIQVGWGWKENTAAEQAEIYRRIRDMGITVSAICADFDPIGAAKPELVPPMLVDMKKTLALAKALKTDVITGHIGVIPGVHNEKWQRMSDAARAVGSLAAANGMKIAIETGPEAPEVLADFIDCTDPVGLAVNLDPANLRMVGGYDPVAAVHILSKRIVHTHAKDGIRLSDYTAEELYGGLVSPETPAYREVPIGEGQVDFPGWLKALWGEGYRGVLCIEREVGDKPEKDIANAVALLKGLMNG